MSFLKDLFRGDPQKSAVKHEQRAQEYEQQGKEVRAAMEWAAAGKNYGKIQAFKQALECYLRAAHLYFAEGEAAREEAMLWTASNLGLEAGNYAAAAEAIDRLTRIGTRLKDDELLLRAFALKTLALIAANDLAKAKETFRETDKVRKRIGRRKVKALLYHIVRSLVARFIDGTPVHEMASVADRSGESEIIDQLVARLVALYNNTKDLTISLELRKNSAKIKEKVQGSCKIESPIALSVVQTQLQLPSSFAVVESLSFGAEASTTLNTNFIVAGNLPGEFIVGPLFVVFQSENQRFQLKSDSVPLKIAAAKPRLDIVVETPPVARAQEEFELSLRVENNSHGDAAEVDIRIALPPTLLLQVGTLEKRIITLPAHQHVQFPLYLVATKADAHEGTIECIYRDVGGRRRTTTYPFVIMVQPRERKPKD